MNSPARSRNFESSTLSFAVITIRSLSLSAEVLTPCSIASIESITHKMYELIAMMEQDSKAPGDRLRLFLDIAKDAQHLKMGTEDKIRYSGKACEEVLYIGYLPEPPI